MADNPTDPLDKILKRLEELDVRLRSMDDRLQMLESPETTGESAPPSRPFDSLDTIIEVPNPPPPKLDLPPLPPSDVPVVPTVPAASTGVPPLPKPSLSAPARVSTAKLERALAGLRPEILPGAKPKQSLEMRIATTWLPWIGLLALAMVCILFAREFSKGPLGKVIVCYVLSAGLIIAGLWKEKKYPHWARPVMAGGLAFSYFATYAMGFVEPMQLLDSLGVKLALLAANLALIFGIAHWKKSEVIGGTALVLGYVTTGVVGNDMAALCSTLALSVTAVIFLWLNSWFVSTAVAVVATYLAHFYVWKAVPEAHLRSDGEAFWFHFMFLSLYFTVYTAASLVGRSALRSEPVESPAYKSRLNLLKLLTQVNLAAYIGGMIAVFKLTGLYWDKVWMFLIPTAGLCSLLSYFWLGVRAVHSSYLVAATVCLTFGLMAVISPLWLPVFLGAQALAMLWRARGEQARLWSTLSFCVLLYALMYLFTQGAVDILRFTPPIETPFPAWTFIAVAGVCLAYAIAWERTPDLQASSDLRAIKYLVACAAAVTWVGALFKLSNGRAELGASLAVPASAALVLIFRSRAMVVFGILAAVISLLAFNFASGTIVKSHKALIMGGALLTYALTLAVEKRRVPDWNFARYFWRAAYIAAAFAFASPMYSLLEHRSNFSICLCLLFALVTAAGWMTGSGALAKSGYVFIWMLMGFLTEDIGRSRSVLCAAILAASAFPIALNRWKYRTGDQQPLVNELGQVTVVLVAGILVYNAGVPNGPWNPVLTVGIWAALVAGYAALGRFPMQVANVMLAAVAAGVYTIYAMGDSLVRTIPNETVAAKGVGYSIAGVLCFVVAERLLAFAPRHRVSSANQKEKWLTQHNRSLVTAGLAVTSLAMMIATLRTLPDLRLFYFTGALVAAAFLWIVFGFLFKESIYRRSGFVLLCFGIVKGLIWDVLSLKETFYRIVSWSILGLLALAASFLYTRFRGQVETERVADRETM